LKALAACDVLLSCQGGDYTGKVYGELISSGWKGYWIDAASTLRMADDAVIILDPVNRGVIDAALKNGIKTYVGGNCTVSLMLMALGGLFREGLVEWVSSMTYQAASGAGAAKMLELMAQMDRLTGAAKSAPKSDALTVETAVTAMQRSAGMPTGEFGAPLAGSLLAWIDKEMPGGQTREEWKGETETNKILGTSKIIPVDGICVRIGTLRCHSQAITVKLTKDVPWRRRSIHASTSHGPRVVPKDKQATIIDLTPPPVTGTRTVPDGRLHILRMGSDYLGAFTVGDNSSGRRRTAAPLGPHPARTPRQSPVGQASRPVPSIKSSSTTRHRPSLRLPHRLLPSSVVERALYESRKSKLRSGMSTE
jgi:aspartate-semialdehyde dehydrogenase